MHFNISDCRTGNGSPALFYAAETGTPDSFKLLLDLGSPVRWVCYDLWRARPGYLWNLMFYQTFYLFYLLNLGGRYFCSTYLSDACIKYLKLWIKIDHFRYFDIFFLFSSELFQFFLFLFLTCILSILQKSEETRRSLRGGNKGRNFVTER